MVILWLTTYQKAWHKWPTDINLTPERSHPSQRPRGIKDSGGVGGNLRKNILRREACLKTNPRDTELMIDDHIIKLSTVSFFGAFFFSLVC